MSTLKYSCFKVNPIFPEVMTSLGHKLSHECSPHFHLDYDFTLVTSGILELKVGNKTLFYSPNQISIINPGYVHYGKGVGKESLSTRNVRISQRFIHQIARANHPNFEFPLLFSESPIFSTAMVTLFETYFDLSRSDDSHPQEVSEMGWKLFNSLIDLSSEGKPNHSDDRRRLSKSIEIMDSDIGTKLTVADIAKAVNLSEYHFIKKFKQIFGLTPYSYFMQMKLEKAFNELIKGEKVSDVAVKYNYSDQAHLSRLIKKHYGYTPVKVKSISHK
ncbi:AraC family transcriptional regulator [Shewanella sp. CG12_big_fil_rev_8_21_14_0_65_47_15]|uniref:AraC family transcriptional regulator n=1 Tax=Shewanella sp. CG12_big_fil_rev_8_21_14_0_65_47_15 TaxID=1975537 RepID=UPI000CC65C3A|nr:AraC family transcriptional regulator [Shewanella sp. CG12_big_fil_rev_8_21_14_0_65_47_15]PIW63096.1 MAG: AraC family transcriptional regulator [Shewanella sp. CG12_big_fil_rev_8_21_14_0_65_47_15]